MVELQKIRNYLKRSSPWICGLCLAGTFYGFINIADNLNKKKEERYLQRIELVSQANKAIAGKDEYQDADEAKKFLRHVDLYDQETSNLVDNEFKVNLKVFGRGHNSGMYGSEKNITNVSLEKKITPKKDGIDGIIIFIGKSNEGELNSYISNRNNFGE